MKTWKKLLLCFVSLTGCLFAGIAAIVACSGEPDPYDYFTSFFHPDVQGKKDFGAFYFTDYSFTYTDEEPVSEATVNAAEWANYLGQSVKAADVEKIMYHLDSAGKESAYHFFEQDAPVPDSLAASKFLWALKDPMRAAAKKYYQFALQAEMLGQSNYNYWEPAPLDTAGLKNAGAEALQAALTETDPFIKLRYFYQAQKLNHYAQNYVEAKNIYEQYITKIPSKSHVKGWALALKAGEERRLGDTTQSAYLFSKVFADYPERRVQAYRNYHYIAAPFEDVLKLARTAEEKANLYAIKGFADPEIGTSNLEKVYENAPASAMVGVLLVREINKLEQYYLTPALNNTSDHFYSSGAKRKTELQPTLPATEKWPLWTGMLVVLAGVTLLIFAYRKPSARKPLNITGVVLLFAGIACLAWFVVNRPTTKAEAQSLAQGSFFVAMPDSVKTKYEAHIEKLRSFCTQLSSDGKYAEPQVGTLVNAYLYFMEDKPDEGLSVLNKMEGQPVNGKLDDQKQIISLLLSAQRIRQVKDVDEAALLPGLKWLSSKVNADGDEFARTQRNFYASVLAPAYLRQADTAKAALAMLNSEKGSSTNYKYQEFMQMPDFWYNYLHTAELKQLINWKKNRPVTSYLAFLSEELKHINEGNMYELLGTIQLREHHYHDALNSFNTGKNKVKFARYEEEGTTSGNPFETAINDYPQIIRQGINKIQFATRMAALETKLKADPKNPDTYFMIATGIYNTSTYGNSWNMISYSWSSYDFGRKPLYYYDADYVKTSTAKQYYLKARELSTDAEFKAKCTFMAAKCEQKQYEAPSFMDNYETYDKREKAYAKQLKSNSYFTEMQQYKSTAFYQKAVDECSYLSDFIKSN